MVSETNLQVLLLGPSTFNFKPWRNGRIWISSLICWVGVAEAGSFCYLRTDPDAELSQYLSVAHHIVWPGVNKEPSSLPREVRDAAAAMSSERPSRKLKTTAFCQQLREPSGVKTGTML